jgi:ferredoxin
MTERCRHAPLVELSECIRCGVCVDVAPMVFSLDAGFVQVADLACYPRQPVDEAIRNCPVDCIRWEAR